MGSKVDQAKDIANQLERNRVSVQSAGTRFGVANERVWSARRRRRSTRRGGGRWSGPARVVGPVGGAGRAAGRAGGAGGGARAAAEARFAQLVAPAEP